MGALTSKTQSYKNRPWELTSVVNPNLGDYYGRLLDFQIRGKQLIKILPYAQGNDLSDNYITNATRFRLVHKLKINRVKRNQVVIRLNQIFLVNPHTSINENVFFCKHLNDKDFFYSLQTQLLAQTVKSALKNLFYSRDFGLLAGYFLSQLPGFRSHFNREVPRTSGNLRDLGWDPAPSKINQDELYIIPTELLRRSPAFSLQIRQRPGNCLLVKDNLLPILSGRHKKLSPLMTRNPLNVTNILLTSHQLGSVNRKLIDRVRKDFRNLKFILFPTNGHNLDVPEGRNDLKVPIYNDRPQVNIFFDMPYRSQVLQKNLNILFGLHNPQEKGRWSFIYPMASPLESRGYDIYEKFDGVRYKSQPVLQNKFHPISELLELLLINGIIWGGNKNLVRQLNPFTALKPRQFATAGSMLTRAEGTYTKR